MSILIGLSGGFIALSIMRHALALKEIKKQKSISNPGVEENRIAVLQAILSGDPALGPCLLQNLQNAPEADFIWLVDEDDPEGQRVANDAIKTSGHAHARIILCPPAPPQINPKTYKLVHGLAHANCEFITILDDDSVLTPGGLARVAGLALEPKTLVTGLPLYGFKEAFWSDLIAGFVNGNSVLTYLPAAQLNLTQTINGMFSVMRVGDIKSFGGFKEIEAEVTDDYALAQLFLNNQGRLVQCTEVVSITTTVRGAAHYASLMRRWMIFANLFLRENFSGRMLLITLLPTLLPLAMVGAGLTDGVLALSAVLAMLVAKNLITFRVNQGLTGIPFSFSHVCFAALSEIILPVHVILSRITPNRIRWRNKTMTLEGKKIVGR